MTTKPDIFEYVDFRKFLTDWRTAQKKRNPGITHEYLCRFLGQKTRSFYNDIEKGRKVISSSVVDRLLKLFELKGAEAKYFRALVGYCQPSTYQEKEFWFEQIIELNNTPKRIIDKSIFRFFNEWHHTIVRALLDTRNIKSDYKQLANSLYNRITPAQAKESINLLKSLDLIHKTGEGGWKPNDKVLSTEDNLKEDCIRRYQVAHNAVLAKILEENLPGTHDSTQLTVSVSKKGLERIVKRIKQIRSEIMSISHKDEEQADRVYQVALHIYPLSKKA